MNLRDVLETCSAKRQEIARGSKGGLQTGTSALGCAESVAIVRGGVVQVVHQACKDYNAHATRETENGMRQGTSPATQDPYSCAFHGGAVGLRTTKLFDGQANVPQSAIRQLAACVTALLAMR